MPFMINAMVCFGNSPGRLTKPRLTRHHRGMSYTNHNERKRSGRRGAARHTWGRVCSPGTEDHRVRREFGALLLLVLEQKPSHLPALDDEINADGREQQQREQKKP